MKKAKDDFLIELNSCSDLWSGLQSMAKESLTRSIKVMIEGGATRQELQAMLNDVLIPQLRKWMHDNYVFIKAAMDSDAPSTSKH